MQTKWLEDFLALAQTGSLTRAAQARHVTHPAFGRRIRALEAWAGQPLFHRGDGPLRLTPAGEALLEAARDALAALAQVRASGQAQDDPGLIRVATGRTLARTLFATWYGQMRPLIGERAIHVATRAVQETAELLERGEADFMLTYYHPLLALRLDPRRFTHLRLADEALVPVTGVDEQGTPVHSLSRRRTTPLLSYTRSLALGRLVEDHLASHLKPPRFRVAIECDSADAAHEFALRGYGVAWLPRSMVAADLRRARMVQAGDRSLEVRLEVRLYRPRRALSRLAETLWQATERHLQD